MWAAATTEGILVYSLATAALFDPTNLAEDVTVPTVHRLIGRGAHLKALLVAVRLGEPQLVRHALYSVPPSDVARVAAALPAAVAVPVLAAAAAHVGETPHVEYSLAWLHALCDCHAAALQAALRTSVMPPLRALKQGLQEVSVRLRPAVERCLHSLEYLSLLAQLPAQPLTGHADAGEAH
jgi:periodic tryptophan protein 2